MAKELLKRAQVDFVRAEDLDRDDIESLLANTERMVELFEAPEVGYLYDFDGSPEAYPFKLNASDVHPEKFKTLSLAVMAMTARRQATVREESREKTVIDAVKKAVKRLARRIPRIESDIKEAADFETYRRHGELLQINLPKLKKGMDSVTVEDVFAGPGIQVEIKLDPALSPSENVEAYFRRHRKGREGHGLLKRRLEITRQELRELEHICSELEVNFEAASERYRAEIEALMPRPSGPRESSAPRLPYREYVLSTGLRIFVGRDGSDNDRTTFDYARPYELWFHTQQCPGSHVVIKFPNRSFEPSKAEIEEAAAVAAWHSRAKNDSLVPVIYTERRHVRKPRKAKPGLVTVEREKSIMVAPKEPSKR
jgi:predicted ribosome quality control (RQC) complex YloA/Tae2 family protein